MPWYLLQEWFLGTEVYSTLSGRAARSGPGQAGAHRWSSGFYHCNLSINFIIAGVVFPPSGVSCRCVVSAAVRVQPAESPRSARDWVAGNCTCPEELHLWWDTSHSSPLTTYPVRLAWRALVWKVIKIHMMWIGEGDTNIHQYLK